MEVVVLQLEVFFIDFFLSVGICFFLQCPLCPDWPPGFRSVLIRLLAFCLIFFGFRVLSVQQKAPAAMLSGVGVKSKCAQKEKNMIRKIPLELQNQKA